MSNKHKITISLSFALAVLFSLPWIALIEQVRLTRLSAQDVPVAARVIFMFVTVFAASVLFFYYNFFWKHLIEWKKPPSRIFPNVMVNLLLVVGVSLMLVALAGWIFNIKAAVVYFAFYFFRNLSIVVVVLLVTYVVDLVEKLRQEKIEIIMLQHQNAEIELAALKSQIDPHFLFNTLTTLSSLVRMNSNETIPFIDNMADTFRYMLEKRTQKLVTVREELIFLQSYLFMMKKRFEDGLHIEIRVGDESMEKHIPQFALQVAVENAIKHNVVSARHALRIELFSHDNHIAIRNNLKEKKSQQGYGIGLDNLAQRYWLMGKKKIKVTKEQQFFEVILPLL